jgi:hypothetical protein
MLTLVRVIASHFVAGFESDGKVRRTAPILRKLLGLTDAEARSFIKAKGWTAQIVVTETQIIQHEESFEVRVPPTQRKFFYFDENAGRRAVTGRMTKQQALKAAQEYSGRKNI